MYIPKIRCANPYCDVVRGEGRVIAKGIIPANVQIKCEHCGAVNDLNGRIVVLVEDKTVPYGERKKIIKK